MKLSQKCEIREFKTPRRQLQRKRSNKIELCVKCFLRLFHVGHFVRNKRSVLSLDAENERLSVVGLLYRRNLKYGNFTAASFGRLLQQTAPKSVPYV